MDQFNIVWTKVDEAPALATYSLLPVVKAYAKACGIEIQTKDISLAGRIIANFPDNLSEDQKQEDALSILGDLAKTEYANIIKLPNISATIPQLQAAIKELQKKGYDIPDYPEEAKTEEEKQLQQRFSKVLGSAVNPVLREGNSDRRPAKAVKEYAKKHPHKMMKPWPEEGSKTRVAHMSDNDFYGSEKSVTLEKPCTAKIEFVDQGGNDTVLKDNLPLEQGEVADTAVMSVAALRKFYQKTIDQAKEDDALLSLHLKATMMKVSDPVIFGHCVSVFYKDALEKHAETLKQIGANPNNGLAGILEKLNQLAPEKKSEIQADIEAVYKTRPALAMVDSNNGITNLHFPNKVIIDASMPNVVRDGGKMWNSDDQLQDTVAIIPDRSYATIYQQVIEDCQKNGQFDPATMGGVSNVGLMAKKAEEYGSHDKTFTAPDNGTIRLVDEQGNVLMAQPVEKGDIFRMCQTKHAPTENWVQLALNRARESQNPAIFWLDENRAHDARIIEKVNQILADLDTTGLDIIIAHPAKAMQITLERVRKGEDTISVTGNVLRDYLTDLFPILELGTSARLLSIVPLMNGGGLFETGAGGSAPKHVEQFLTEGLLRWDSLGEYCALMPSFQLIAKKTGNKKANILAAALDNAIGRYLENEKTPSRKVGEPDNRSATFYLAMYWAKALANQSEDKDLQQIFSKVASELEENQAKIDDQLLTAQGKSVEIGGYYLPDAKMAEKSMRPSDIFNRIIDSM